MAAGSPEDRLWQELFRRLDNIEHKVDGKVDYHTFNAFKIEITAYVEKIEADLETVTKAAVSPDQVTSMISQKLQESHARGITSRERGMRYLVAIASLATTGLLIYDRAVG